MGKVFIYPMAYYNEDGECFYSQKNTNNLIEELKKKIKTLEEDVEYYKTEVKNAYVPGNALYGAIISKVEPFFPKYTRELDWDVLPGAMYKLAKENYHMKELLTKMNLDISKILKDMGE